MMIVIRCDAGSAVGLGHVMRCLAFAQAARDLGARCRFVLPECPSAVRRRLEAEGFAVAASGLPGGSEADATDVGRRAVTEDAAAVVMDSYTVDRGWMQALRATAGPRRLLRLDDAAEAAPLIDEWVSGPIGPVGSTGPAGQADSATPRLLGPAFALIRREHLQRRDEGAASASTHAFGVAPEAAPAGSRPPRILITMGGSDPAGLTEVVLEGLAPLRRRATISVLIGGAHPAPGPVIAACDRAGVPCLRDVSDMASLLAATDITCTAAGSTTWEACLHACSLVLTPVAENQRPIARLMADRAGALLVPEAVADEPAAWAAPVVDLLEDPEGRMARARRAATLVDGFGADRVAMRLLDQPFRLRAAGPADAAVTAGWTGEPPDEHARGFTRAIRDPGTILLMAHDVREVPVAIVRARRTAAGGWRLDHAFDPRASGGAAAGADTKAAAAAADAAAIDAAAARTLRRLATHRLPAGASEDDGGVVAVRPPAIDADVTHASTLRWTDPSVSAEEPA